MKIDIDLNSLNAEQIALLDAVVSSLPVPSKVKNEIIDAGYANCGESEYRREYMTKCDLLNGKAIAAAVAEAVKAEREQCAKAAEQFECDTYEDGWQEMERGARHLAAVIRARNGAK